VAGAGAAEGDGVDVEGREVLGVELADAEGRELPGVGVADADAAAVEVAPGDAGSVDPGVADTVPPVAAPAPAAGTRGLSDTLAVGPPVLGAT
jgi:hypothetical protein